MNDPRVGYSLIVTKSFNFGRASNTLSSEMVLVL